MDSSAVQEQYVDDVYGYLAYRAGSREAAEDLTQQTLERALRGWGSFDPGRGHARTWVLAIARSVYIDSRRLGMSGSRSSGKVRESLVNESDLVGAVGPDPQITAALRRLELRERETIALRFGADLRVAEIAEVLGVSISNAQQILSRALRRLHSILDA